MNASTASARGGWRVWAVLMALALTGACGGGGGTPTPAPGAPANLQYAVNPGSYRVGEAILPNVPSTGGGAPQSYGVSPNLPAGLQLDQLTGIISGTPTTATALAQYVVTAINTGGSTQETIALAVGAALPSAFESLAAGFEAEVVLEPPGPTLPKIAKLALAPSGDDRIFYTEVDTGDVRVIDPNTGLNATPFVHLDVLGGGHNGLLGLALAPDFATSGHVYVLACIPGTTVPMTSDRIQVRRYTDVNSIGTNEVVVIDDLPIAPPGGINNGGEILFDNTDRLLVSIGDVQESSNAHADASISLAGKILRYNVSAGAAQIPTDNPFPSSPEWCRGLRNTFGLAVHPTTGGLFGADNGPAANDELNFLQAGKHFGWGGTPAPADAGFTVRTYPTVIVPTALCWHTGVGWGAAYADNLFLASYDDHTIRRFEMSGAAFTDIDAEDVFATLKLSGSANHPLDICVGPDGSIYISTFSGLYRISKL